MNTLIQQGLKHGPRIIFTIITVVLFFLFSGCENLGKDSDFEIRDREKVDFIAIYGNDSVKLERSGSEWILNKDLRPDPTAIENFFYAFENIDIAGATTGGQLDTMISRKIIIKRKNRPVILRFFASENYYLLNHQGSSDIYRVKVLSAPDANLEEVFSDDPEEWRKREFISVIPDELQEIRVIPQPRFGKGFVMRKDSSGFKVFDLMGNELSGDRLDTEKTLLYASYLDEIYFTEEISEDTILERISKDDPFYEFFIKTRGDAGYSFGVYPLYDKNGKEDLFFGSVKIMGKKPVLKVNYANLDFLFQNFDYFTVE